MNHEEIFNVLAKSPKVDVCVLGGGINGLSVFRELALQGVNVLLVEEADGAPAIAPAEECHAGQFVQTLGLQDLHDGRRSIAAAIDAIDATAARIGDAHAGTDVPALFQRFRNIRRSHRPQAESIRSMFWTAAPEAPLPRLS